MNAPTRTAEAATLGAAGPDLLEARPAFAMAAYQPPPPTALILHRENFQALLELADLMSKSKGVPKHLRGDKGMCLAVVMQAMRWNMDPFAVATKTYVTEEGGVLRYEGQLVIAVINNCGLLQDRLDFEHFGDWDRIQGKFTERETKKKDRDGRLQTDANGEVKKYLAKTWSFADEEGLGVVVRARLRGEQRPRELRFLLQQAKTRNSTLWVEDPAQQICYLAGRRWASRHAPDAILGIQTIDDGPRDMGMVDVVPEVPQELIDSGLETAKKGMPAYQEWWKARTHHERDLLDDQSDWHEKLKIIAAEASQLRGGTTAPKTSAASPPPASSPTASPSPTPAPTAQPTPEPTAAPVESVTFAKVLDMLVKAQDKKDVDALDIAADWIGDVADPQHRAELVQKYDAMRAELAKE